MQIVLFALFKLFCLIGSKKFIVVASPVGLRL